jgi:hypothetical protein
MALAACRVDQAQVTGPPTEVGGEDDRREAAGVVD